MELINNFSEIFLSVWNKGILGVDIFQILIGIGIFLLFLIFRGLISKLVIKKLEIISKRTTNKLDDTFVQSLVGPARFLPIVLGFFIASYYMTFSLEGREVVDTINRTLITILIFWVIHQIIEPISYILSGLDKLLTRELIGWIIKSLKILIFILGLAAVLELWGIKIGPIIAGLGLFGVAVALGAQDLFKNLISGILVLVEKRFKIGDWIAVEGIIEGVVEKIGFRSTTIRKFDKSLAIIPNFQFAENAVVNVSETSNWLISWIITLQYDTTVDQLKKIRDEIESHINSSEDYNTSIGVAVRVDKFSDSSIDMYVRCFTKTGSWNNLYSYVVIANVIVSWLIAFNVLNTQNRFVYAILELSYKLTEPFLNKIRRFLPNLGSLDISPIILLLLIWFIEMCMKLYIAPMIF